MFGPNIFRSDITACSRVETRRVSMVNLNKRIVSDFCRGWRGGNLEFLGRCQKGFITLKLIMCLNKPDYGRKTICVRLKPIRRGEFFDWFKGLTDNSSDEKPPLTSLPPSRGTRPWE